MLLIKIIVISIFFALNSFIVEANIKIKYKIGTEIITNIDILSEKDYLIFLRPSLKNLPEDEILKISENSLIREIIKKREINRIFKNFEDTEFMDEIKKNLYNFKNVDNENEFKLLAKENNINYEKVLEKIKFEGLWNDFIFKKYNSLVRIDKNKLKNQLSNKLENNKKYEYNISEIIFEINEKENLSNKKKIIINYIKNNSFKAAASKFSVSNTSQIGGEIGWVKETLLSEKLSKELSKILIGGITDVIKHPSGYLLLKVNDKRQIKQVINAKKELKNLINYERNKQLNQFSLLHYKKLKQNIIINEF